jgi:hypothetical protein
MLPNPASSRFEDTSCGATTHDRTACLPSNSRVGIDDNQHLTDRFHNRLYQSVLRIKSKSSSQSNADQQGSARHYLLLAQDFGMARRGLSKNRTFYADRIVIASRNLIFAQSVLCFRGSPTRSSICEHTSSSKEGLNGAEAEISFRPGPDGWLLNPPFPGLRARPNW